MKQINFYIGAFFITAGFLWLNYYFDIINIHTGDIYKYWPIFLVILGLSLLNLPKFFKSAFSFLAGVLTSLLIYSAMIYFIGLNKYEKEKLEKEVENYFDNKKAT
ncbi:DUF5668 domain-containing protein [Candidatus Kapabacteria bacterium]|nr:DUF5668 domain-containing protein [Candidatus Kapabacteria bacterium]